MFEVYETLTHDGSKWHMASFKFKHHADLYVKQMLEVFAKLPSNGYRPVSYEIVNTLRKV